MLSYLGGSETHKSVRANRAHSTVEPLRLVTYQLKPSLNIFGEEFFLEEADGQVFLTHPQWSLLGSGNNPPAAFASLITEARDLAKEMANDDPASLSNQARRLREFVLRVK